MATPQANEGMQKAAHIQVTQAAKLLQQQFPHFPMGSPEFDAIRKALDALAKVFGAAKHEDQRLFPAETMNLLSSMGGGAKPPGMGAPAGAPPAAPAA